MTETSGMSDGELLAYMGTDAQRWAQEFLRIKAEIERADDGRSTDDEGWMIGWFANAIGAGERAARSAGPNVRD